MGKVTKVLLLLKDMIYESTSPLEIIRFAKYYRSRGLEVTVVLWGPMGILLGKKNKFGRMQYEDEMNECLKNGIKFKCCDLAAYLIGLDKSELMEGISSSKDETLPIIRISRGRTIDFFFIKK